MQNLRIETYRVQDDLVKELFPKFIQAHFDCVDLSDPEVQAEMTEWYWKPADVHLVAYLENDAVGIIHATKRKVEVQGQQVTLACLGGLVVHKLHRGQGIASELIQEWFKIATDWNADVAFLNTDIGNRRTLYIKVGFVPLGHSYSFIGKSGELIEDGSGMIAPVNSREKFELVLNDSEVLFIGEGNL